MKWYNVFNCWNWMAVPQIQYTIYLRYMFKIFFKKHIMILKILYLQRTTKEVSSRIYVTICEKKKSLFFIGIGYPGRICKKLVKVITSGERKWVIGGQGWNGNHSDNFLKRGWRHYKRSEISFYTLGHYEFDSFFPILLHLLVVN